MRVTILGSGSSSGVPMVGRGWGKCDPENPKNARLRASILVEDGDTTVLVDTSPDLRQQLLTAGTERLDGVIFTHFHADHLHGIDDLRAINWAMNAPIDIFADDATLDVIDTRFKYVLEPLPADAKVYFKPTLKARRIEDGAQFRIGSIDFDAFEQDHGYSKSLGFRFGPICFR